MKFRNGFVSNSSSSSFILKKLPKDVKTPEQVFDFYGMSEGREIKWCVSHGLKDEDVDDFCKHILKMNKKGDTHFIDDYFRTGRTGKFLEYYGDGFDNGYGFETLLDIYKNPDDYFEFSIDDTYLNGPGCAFNGSYITKNGVEINCH